MQGSDTIVALATPPGSGGIAVIRISGPQAKTVLTRLHSKGHQAVMRPRELILGSVHEGAHIIDQGLAVFMPGPRSYTGEDVAELQLHASEPVVQAIITAATGVGARVAEPGEFTKRAYLAGKLDLAQAEAVADLIAASSTGAAKQASAQVAGELSHKIQSLRADVVGLIAEISANLDFGEEDIPDLDAEMITGRLVGYGQTLEAWLGASDQAVIIRSGYNVAIIGLPNAGKSSLLNALVGYERAIVTNIAGTTRDTLDETIEVDGLAIHLTDTAGLTETSEAVEQIGVRRAQQAAERADIVLLAASANQDISELIAAGLPSVPVLAVQTKIDEQVANVSWPEGIVGVVKTSAKTGVGIKELRHRIRQLAVGNSSSQEIPLFSNLRHVAALRQAREHLESARGALNSNQPFDVVAGELMLMAQSLTTILGENVGSEVIDAIFSKFCIGK